MTDRLRYYPVHLHLHTSMESGGSLAGHIYNAKNLGMRYIWFTDHDYRLNIRPNAVLGFPFDRPEMTYSDAPGAEPVGWQAFPSDCARIVSFGEQYALELSANSENNTEWTVSKSEFVSGKNFIKSRLVCSLLHDVTVKLKFDGEGLKNPDVRVIVEITLSKRPPDGAYARMLYVWGDSEGLNAPHTQILKRTGTPDTLALHVSEDVSEASDIGGTDNAFAGVSIRLETRNLAEAKLLCSHFQVQIGRKGDAVRALQRQWADRLYQETGVRAFIGNEVSRSGMHKNCFSTGIPLISGQGESIPEEEGAEWLTAQGAVYGYNHPLTDAMSVEEKKTQLLATRAYGAKLTEIAYPEGRKAPCSDYLRLWDELTSAGLFLTGYGSSDSHDFTSNWYSGNNFCAFLGVPERMTDPVPETAFLSAMLKGNAYTGDPTVLAGALDFTTADGLPQGCVLEACIGDSVGVRFTAKNTKVGWKFRYIVNGTVEQEQTLCAGDFLWESTLMSVAPVSFARCELYNEAGRLIAVTNPIHLACKSVTDIPKTRFVRRENWMK